LAKKVRRRPEEEGPVFEFPEFDETSFLKKEFELAGALWLAVALTVVLGALSWLATRVGLPWYVPFPLGILFVAVSPLLIGRLRTNSGRYTKGDWAGLLAFEFFGWLALWFVLLDVT
jgi:hypothetical protein